MERKKPKKPTRRKSPNKRKAKSDAANEYLPQIAFRATADQVEKLDELARASRGRLNRSDLIRQAIDKFLE